MIIGRPVTRVVMAGCVLTVVAPQIGELDKALVTDIRRQVEVGQHPPVDTARVQFVDDTVTLIPGLKYRWAVYSAVESIASPRFYSVAAIGPMRARVIDSPAAWGSVVSPWYPRDAHEAKAACVDFFRHVRHAVGPSADMVQLYELNPMILQHISPEEKSRIIRNIRTGSRVQRLSNPARWQTDVWVLTFRFSTTIQRVRCTLPASWNSRADAYSVTILKTVPPPAFRRVM